MQEWEYTRIGIWRINAVHANGEFGHASPLRNSRELDTSPATHQAHNRATPDEAYFAALPFAQMQAA